MICKISLSFKILILVTKWIQERRLEFSGDDALVLGIWNDCAWRWISCSGLKSFNIAIIALWISLLVNANISLKWTTIEKLRYTSWTTMTDVVVVKNGWWISCLWRLRFEILGLIRKFTSIWRVNLNVLRLSRFIYSRLNSHLFNVLL